MTNSITSAIPETIVFDWDGTLYDADFLFDSAIERVLREEKQSAALSHVESLLYRERETPLRNSLRLPMQGRSELVRAIGQAYVALEEDAALFPGIAPILYGLANRGCKLGVVTGRNRKSFDLAVKKAGLGGVFAATICGGEAPAKPDPTGIRMVLSALGAMQGTAAIYVGNQVADAIAAQRAGIGFIGVRFCSRSRTSSLSDANLVHCMDTQALANLLAAP